MAEFGEAEAIDSGGDEEEGRRSDGRGREEAAGREEMMVCVLLECCCSAHDLLLKEVYVVCDVVRSLGGFCSYHKGNSDNGTR